MSKLYGAAKEKIASLLKSIYGQDISSEQLERFFTLIEENIKDDAACNLEKWNEEDAVLITYGDSVLYKNEKPLQTLHRFLSVYLKDRIKTVHILPFSPYSSDDGFSVIDYYKVDPKLGTWEDIAAITSDFKLMADLVINHVSSESLWFRNYLEGKSPGKNFFIEMNPETDLSEVTRPRSHPLLTKFQTNQGPKFVWTTFSEDQIDLDFSNPEVLYQMLKVLFFYIHKSVRIIRLDAIAYLWKKVGTSCIHLPETHQIVHLIRELAELIHPDTIILTETNVPHKENLSYFGDYNEAHMIYQFPLPPLLLHALHSGTSKHLSEWAKSIPETKGKGTYLNFTASHDGIGVRPLEGVLPKNEKSELIAKMKQFGGFVSTKTNNDGTESPYEINITYFDALKGTAAGIDSLQVERFLCSQTIMIALKGIPAFYIHSLLATENDHEGVEKTGKYRAINRKKLELDEIYNFMIDRESNTSRVFSEVMRRLEVRKRQKAFHPDSKQIVLDLGNTLFAFRRKWDEESSIYHISNVSSEQVNLNINDIEEAGEFNELISEQTFKADEEIVLEPYQTLWLKANETI